MLGICFDNKETDHNASLSSSLLDLVGSLSVKEREREREREREMSALRGKKMMEEEQLQRIEGGYGVIFLGVCYTDIKWVLNSQPHPPLCSLGKGSHHLS